MKILLASVSLLLASTPGMTAAQPAPASPIVAENAERLDLARRFVDLIQPVGSMLDVMREAALGSAQAELGPDADEAEQAALAKRIDQVLAKLEPRFKGQQPAIEEAYAQAYSRQFSTDELRALVAFGASPAGQHYLSSMVDIETDPLVAEANQSLSDAMLSVMDDIRKEGCAERAAERLAMGDKRASCPLSKADDTQSL